MKPTYCLVAAAVLTAGLLVQAHAAYDWAWMPPEEAAAADGEASLTDASGARAQTTAWIVVPGNDPHVRSTVVFKDDDENLILEWSQSDGQMDERL